MPPLGIPESQKTVKDEGYSMPAYSFLVEHEESGRRVLFDLGIRKNFEEYPPAVKGYHSDVFRFKTGEEVLDMLRNGEVDPATIEAIIWSHHHVDQVGNPSLFPYTTDLIVGPGFKETILPGYPKNPKSQVLESDYEGRNLCEINFDDEWKGLTIGGFRAIDFFNDGSFYLLESPGPLPKELEPSPLGAHSELNNRFNVCPGELFIEHAHPQRSGEVPFPKTKAGHPYDREMAERSVRSMERFDADDNVFIITAHDAKFSPGLDFWPKGANGWFKAGWKESSTWEFLKDFYAVVVASVQRVKQ
ncbi:putative metallo-beta-lactamase superfamily protein [Seiridium unicorne]|uniref:Metallo-beta-lactamase superfamily protein n=1 Tax=Seiridium unicorne TaxID=138068 RepID=A0ABR2UXS7_9PEZI